MFLKLVFLFTVIPVIELMILLRINQSIGPLSTILLVMLTGIVGAWLAKSEGRSILTRIQKEMAQGQMPGDELVNGLCVLIGGILLITPGVLTDLAGFLLILPLTRDIVKVKIKNKMRHMIQAGAVNLYYHRNQ